MLPHVVDPDLYDGPVPARRIAGSAAGLIRVLGQDLADRAQLVASARRSGSQLPGVDNPRLVIFLDDYRRVASRVPVPDAELTLRDLSITTVHLLSDRLHEPSDVTVRIMIDGSEAQITDARLEEDDHAEEVQGATLDKTPVTLFESIARMLAPLRLSLSREDQVSTARDIGITELLGITDLAMINPDTAWQPRSPRDFLRVPIGVDDLGAPVLLDLKESAQLGMGPHGICIGATGSGKSEMLRTLILALALTHPPEDLEHDPGRLQGRCRVRAVRRPAARRRHHRQPRRRPAADRARPGQHPRRGGPPAAAAEGRRARSPSISHYRELRRERPELPPLPHLFLVIDEFGELLTAEPDFVDLLAHHRPHRPVDRRAPAAVQPADRGRQAARPRHLPVVPDRAAHLLRVGERRRAGHARTPSTCRDPRLRLPQGRHHGLHAASASGYVSGPVAAVEPGPVAEPERRPRRAAADRTIGSAQSAEHADDAEAGADAAGDRPARWWPSASTRLTRGGRRSTPVWLPPLPHRLTLAGVLSDDGRRVGPTVHCSYPSACSTTRPQRSSAVAARPHAVGGHVAVIGAPQSGRSTFLRTLAASVACTHTPREVSIYGMDLTGGGLARIDGFPHVGGVATRGSPRPAAPAARGAARRCWPIRERVFREHGIDSLAHAAAPSTPPDGSRSWPRADVVLLVDGFGALRTDFEELEDSRSSQLLRARRQLRHPRRRDADAVERAADGPPAAGRHPAGAPAERPGRLADRRASSPRRSGPTSRAGC